MEDKCICCGAIVPEGRQVCPKCENATSKNWTEMKDVRKAVLTVFQKHNHENDRKQEST